MVNGNMSLSIIEEICFWPPAHSEPSIGDRDVHVWFAKLDLSDSQLHSFYEILNETEAQKSERFHFERHRVRYIVSHGILRKILSLYLNIPPQALRFRSGVHGKPSLDLNQGNDVLHFNMARSGSFAIYAITRLNQVGVDIEKMRSNVDFDQIVRQYFSAEELESYRKLPAENHQVAFYHGWTRKEAYIKATGDGLHHRLDQFSVSINPKDTARLISIAGNPQAAHEWTLHGIDPAPGYVAALAVRGVIQQLDCREWIS